MRLVHKLFLHFIIIFFLVSTGAVYFIIQSDKVFSFSEDLSTTFSKISAVSTIRFYSTQILSVTNNYINTKKDSYKQQYFLLSARLHESTAGVSKYKIDPEESEILKTLSSNVDSADIYAKKICDSLNRSDYKTIIRTKKKMYYVFENKVETAATDFLHYASLKAILTKEYIKEYKYRMFLAFPIIAFMLLTFAVVLSYKILTNTVKRLSRLSNYAIQISEGNYSLIPLSKSQDEIGELTNAFNYMAESLEFSYSERQRNNEFYQSIINIIPSALLVFNHNDEIVLANKKFCEWFGAPCELILGHSIQKILDDSQLPLECKSRILKKESCSGYECKSLSYDQTFSVSLSTIRHADNQDMYLIVFQDISEIKFSVAQLEDLAERYKTILETTVDGFWLLDAKGNFLDVNENYCKMSGYTKDELLHSSIPDVEANETPEETALHIKKVIDEGAARFETKHKKKNGSIWEAEVSTIFLREKHVFIAFIRDISERNSMLSELKLKDNAISNAINAVAMADQNGVINYVNRSFLKMWNYDSEAEVVGKHGTEIWDDAEKAVEVLELVRKNDRWTGELVALKKDGSRFIIRAAASTLKNESGDIIRIYASLMDVTEQKKYEKEILKLSQAVEQNPVAVLITDKDGSIEYVNRKFTDMTGFTLEEVYKKNPRIIQSGSTSRKIYNDLWSALQDGKIWQGEFQNKRKDGSLYWQQIILSPLKDENGNIIKYLAVQQDITDRKILEEELKNHREHLEELVQERTNELRLSEEKFRALTENSEDLIMRFDKDLNYLYTNKAVLKHTGVALDRIIGRPCSEIPVFDSYSSVKCIENAKLVFYDKQLKRFEFQLENGRWIDMIMIPEYDETLNVNTLVVSGRDITILKEYEKTIEESLRKEKELNDLKNKFISTASHEFRTPLAAILSSAQMIKRYSKKWNDDELNEHHKIISDSVKNITELMDDVLFISKTEDGKIKLKTESLQIPEMMNDLINNVKHIAKPKQQILYSHNGDYDKFITDKKALTQIVSNLISNAIKYSLEGKEINLQTEIKNNLLLIFIKDQGIGISKDDLPFIFDPFFRAKNNMHVDGTGLGLNIVKRMVDLLDGNIRVESELNKGTTFEILIPLLQKK